MTAAQERAFSARADAAGRALWPGRVRIDGEGYACTLTRTTLQLVADDVPAGVREVEGIRVEIDKCELPQAPAMETVVEDLADGGLYRLKRLDGRMEGDTSWLLTCAKKA